MAVVLEEKKQLEQQIHQQFLELEKHLPGNGYAEIRQLRQQAIERFLEHGFPTTKNEDWKYTNILPLVRKTYQPAPELPVPALASQLREVTQAKIHAFVLNGRFAPDLLSKDGLPEGCILASLKTALDEGEPRVLQHLGRYAEFQTQAQALVAWNTAFVEDGIWVWIPNGTVIEEPIYLFHLCRGAEQPTLIHPRVLVVVGENAQAKIVEVYAGEGEGEYLNNAVSEVVVGEGSFVTHIKLQLEAEHGAHIATVQAHLGRNAGFRSHLHTVEGQFVRNDTNARLTGEGSEALFYGLYVAKGTEHIDNHTFIDHAAPHTTSNELYKGILAEKSTGVFNGKIMVRPGAQKTNAYQNNKNLLLSYDATINTKPQLEIFADDVRCTHGATVGQLEEDAIFYLRSRGIPLTEARILLIHAFANDVLEEMPVEPLRTYLDEELTRRLMPILRA